MKKVRNPRETIWSLRISAPWPPCNSATPLSTRTSAGIKYAIIQNLCLELRKIILTPQRAQSAWKYRRRALLAIRRLISKKGDWCHLQPITIGWSKKNTNLTQKISCNVNCKCAVHVSLHVNYSMNVGHEKAPSSRQADIEKKKATTPQRRRNWTENGTAWVWARVENQFCIKHQMELMFCKSAERRPANQPEINEEPVKVIRELKLYITKADSSITINDD